jgi:decaprenyl-phosphate phosphoribosyltransferase
MFNHLLKLARPHQYTKNIFIFLPAFFSFKITDYNIFFNAFLAFISFSLTASSVYVLNDWIDRHEDAKHPEKKNRPIASGKIKGKTALFFSISLLITGLLISSLVSLNALLLIVLYVLLNITYTFKLKHISIVDITIIASGFVIRLFVGSIATNIMLSHWIIIMTFLLAIFLSLAKRRDDVLIYLNTDQKMRKVIDGYSIKFLDFAMVMNASVVLVAYILWSISPEVAIKLRTNNLYLSSIFVFLGILRYMQIVFIEEKSGNPSKIFLTDPFIRTTILFWVGICFYFLYW